MSDKTEPQDSISIESLNFAEKTEKSLKEFTNWILGISVGAFYILLVNIKNLNIEEIQYGKLIYKALVGYSLATILVTGLTKYHLLLRDNKMSVSYSTLLKLRLLKTTKSKEEIKEEWDKAFSKWHYEHSKVQLMSKFLNLSIVATSILIIGIGIFLIRVI